MEKSKIRNIAIIAHVDHGKTTLVDQLLRQSGTFRDNEQVEDCVMDSNDLEREKGITIISKNTSINYKEHLINIVDTPGHADFGGEVERIMKMVNGVLLVVDAFEGCMPQTRFVLKKALEAKLVPIVVINKMDKPYVRPAEVVDEVVDLFIDLGATEDQLDFPVIYAAGVKGIAGIEADRLENNLKPLFDEIIDNIPAPNGDPSGPFQAQITLMDYSDYVGKIAISTINRGTIQVGDTVSIIGRNGTSRESHVTKLYGFQGLQQVNIQKAGVGEIVAIAGLGPINVGETICTRHCLEAMPFIQIEEPTLEMHFLINNSPFAGKEGEPVTSRKLWARLERETDSDVALQINETDSADAFRVAGRGELHLAILIEKMRREGLEFQVSKPQVILKEENGTVMEPYEYVSLDLPETYMGSVMEQMSRRYGEMKSMQQHGSEMRMEYIVPTRGMVGFRTQFLTETHGYGIMSSVYEEHRPFCGTIEGRRSGALIVHESGVSTSYGLKSAEDRGHLFVGPGEAVYHGMIIGESNRDQDIVVNICKEKKLTNTRAAGKDDSIQLKGARNLSLEECISFLNDDEYLEVTPKHLRIRKRFLNAQERAKHQKHLKHNQ